MEEKKFPEFYPGWKTVRKIGTGSFGTVYEIERDLFGKIEKAALKVISIPQNEGDVEELYSNGYDDASITAHFKDYLADIVREYSLMAEMKGHTNVVYCDDIRYIQHDDGFGWDIYIKMELLTSLLKSLEKTIREEQVIKLGIDLCNALVLCKGKNIVHRDIKPQNIFVSNTGDYKLGDFGIAKTVEQTTGGTKIGTYNYMAPEVYNNQPYGSGSDIYSLGLVMYWLLNERRLPFLPLPPKTPTSAEVDAARLRRFTGEAIPAPKNGSKGLKAIVLKACAYDPKDRYQSAQEMLDALDALRHGETVPDKIAPVPAPELIPDSIDEVDETVGPDWDKTICDKDTAQNHQEIDEEKTVGPVFSSGDTEKQETKKKPRWIAAVAAVLAVVALVVFFFASPRRKTVTPELNVPETVTPELNVPETGAPVQEETASPEMNAPVVPVEQVALKVWVPEEEVKIVQAMCTAFDEAHPEYECTFDISVVGIYESESLLSYDPELAADVMQLPSGGISQLNEAGLLLPITANLEATQALYGKGAIAAVTRYSEDSGMNLMYGVPFSPNCFFMYYNKDLYTEEEVKSLETMLAKDLGEDVYNFSFTLHDSWYIESFFYAAGCTLFGADGSDPTDMTWNNANGLTAAEYIINLVGNPKYIEDRDGVAGSLMKDGKLGALCSGNWSYFNLHEVLGDKLGACALPTIELNGKTCQLSNFADYKCFAVKSNTAHPLAAQLLAEWLANPENQLVRYQEAGVVPCALGLMENEKIASNVSTVALIAQTQYATPQPSIAQLANYWTPVAALGEGFEKGTITMDNVQAMLTKVVNEVLRSS